METLQTLLPPKPLAANVDIDDPAEILQEQTKFHRSTMAGLVKNISRYLYLYRSRYRRLSSL